MIKKGNLLYNIINNKCPRCSEGDFFVEKNPWKLRRILKLYEYCSVCSLKYMKEPAFFYGAMYVNYGLSVGLGIGIFILTYTLLETSIQTSFISITIALIILAPLLLRLSRFIWISFFESYQAHYKNKN